MTTDGKPKVAPDDFWMKTRFYREGPYLSVVSTAVCKGEPEIFRARVDLRPFELAVRRYHSALHAEASGASQDAMDASNSAPAALKPHDVDVKPVLEVPHVPVQGYDVGAAGVFPYPAWLQIHIKNASSPDRQRWVGFAMAAVRDAMTNQRKLKQARTPEERAKFQARVAEMAGYDQPNGPSTRPDDPFWKATPKRLNDRARYLKVAEGRKWTVTHHSFLDDLGDAVSAVGHAIGKIPVIGDVTHIAAEAIASPLKLARNIATGQRLDHALMGSLKDQVKIIKDVAPYAQTVASLVPGIGTGVSAMIGAGTALAEGKSLDEVTKAAIKGALPGGPAAAAGFDLATKVLSGENVGQAALESARNMVPPGPAQKAFDVGVAVATGEKLQNAVARGLTDIAAGDLAKVVQAGQQAVLTVPGLAAAKKLIAVGPASKGFDVAAGLLSHAGVNQKGIEAVRAKLEPAVRHGFDAALKTQEKHHPWLGNVLSGASAIGKGAETMGKAALLREVAGFRNGVVARSRVASKSTVPSVPEPKLPGVVQASNAALAAYAAANQAWNSIEDGKNAAAAVSKIASAGRFVNQVKGAAQKVGPARAAKGLAESPALKDALATAIAVKDASKRVTPAVVSKAVAGQTEATRKIAELTSQMKHATDPKVRQAAATSMKILKIVADNRTRLEGITKTAMQNVPHVGCCIGGDPGRIGCASDVGCCGGCVGCVGGHHGGAGHFANVQMGTLPGGYHPHMMTVSGHHGGISHFANARPGNIRGGYHPHQMTVGAAHHGIVMTIGSRGRMVMKWQKFLNLFSSNHLKVDGAFGRSTAAATKSFQSAYGLTPDGVVGPSTLGKAIQIQDSMAYPGLEADLRVSGHHGGAGHFSNVEMGTLPGGYHPHQMTVGGHHGGIRHYAGTRFGNLPQGYNPHQMSVGMRLDGGDITSILTDSHPFDDVVEGRPRPMAERHARTRRRHQILDGIAAVDAASTPEEPVLIALCMDQIRRNRALGARP